MDALTKLKILAGLKIDDAEYIKGLIAEDVTPDIAGPIKSGGKHLFYLVTNATPNSTMGDVISEVDTIALAQIVIGAGASAPKKEKWELFPHHLQKDALELAKSRLEAAKKAATSEGVEQEEKTKVSPEALTAINHIMSKINDDEEEAVENHEEDQADMFARDYANYQSIHQNLKSGNVAAARKTYKRMDTAARDHTSDKKCVPNAAVRKEFAKLFDYTLLHEANPPATGEAVPAETGYSGQHDMKKTKQFYLERAKAAIDADENIIYDVASNLGQNLDNVKDMAWFKKQVAVWIAHDQGEDYDSLVKESEEATDGDSMNEAKNDKAQNAMLGAPAKIGTIGASPVAKNTSADVKKASIKDTKNVDVVKVSTDKIKDIENLADTSDLITDPMTSDEMTSNAGSDDKVKVPTNVMKALTDKIAELRAQAKAVEVSNPDLAQYYDATATIFDDMATALKTTEGCRPSMLALYVNKFATPTVQDLPGEVWNFLINGGKIRSLSDRFKEVKEQKKKESK